MKLGIKNALLALLFGLYVLVGLIAYPRYGISWDEPISRSNGMVNLKYLESTYFPTLLTPDVAAQPDLATWPDRDYGVAFELPLAALEQAFGIKGEHIYPFRHLLTFLFFTCGVLAIYKTAAFIHGDYRAGLLAALILVLSPRMFGESFYNTKDLVFLTAIALSMYTMTRLLWTPRWTWAALHGLACGFAIDVRVMGVVMIPLTVAFLLVRLLKREIPARAWAGATAAYLAATIVVVVALFPFLWDNTVGNFLATFSNMAKFRWNNWVLYLGELRRSTELPWHYIPVWMLVTIPPLFTLLMLAGLAKTGLALCRNRLALWSDSVQMSELSFVALLFGPIIAIIAMHSVLYDGWRHLYFVYPAFVLVATSGAIAIWSRIRHLRFGRGAFVGCLALALLCNIAWIIRAHPLQNVYFNFLAGSNWKERFDLDYWGMANRDALQAILDEDKSPLITVRVVGMSSLAPSLNAFPSNEAGRVLVVDRVRRARYLLTNYRGTPKGIAPAELVGYAPFYEKKVGSETIMTVFRIQDTATEDLISRTTRTYTAEDLADLCFSLEGPRSVGDKTYVDFRIDNSGPRRLSALTTTDTPLRVSWRFLAPNGEPMGGFKPRIELPKDIPAHGALLVPIEIERRQVIPGGTLQADILQEGVFWGQWIGLTPATLPWPASPLSSSTSHPYPAEAFRQLRYSLRTPREVGGKTYVDLEIVNAGPQRLSALSTSNTPIRVSWRFLDHKGVPVGGFEPRIALPADIPAHGSLIVPMQIDPKMVVADGTLQADIVQEGTFWGEWIGLKPATLPWPRGPRPR